MIIVLLKLCLRSTPDLLSSDKSDEDDQGGLNARFKTEICRNFKEKGHCLYGDLCQFAHGKDVSLSCSGNVSSFDSLFITGDEKCRPAQQVQDQAVSESKANYLEYITINLSI